MMKPIFWKQVSISLIIPYSSLILCVFNLSFKLVIRFLIFFQNGSISIIIFLWYNILAKKFNNHLNYRRQNLLVVQGTIVSPILIPIFLVLKIVGLRFIHSIPFCHKRLIKWNIFT